MYFEAASIRRLRSSLFSSSGTLELTRPSTTVFPERGAVSARVQHRGRRHGELGRALRDRLQEFEVLEHGRLGAADPALHRHERRLLVGVLELRVAVGIARGELDAVEAVDEI